MTRWFCSVALGGLCAAPGAAIAAQPGSALAAETENADAEAGSDGRTIVVSATRTPITIDDAPVTISSKSDEEIADELATDIKDLVRFEPGVSVRRQPARFGAALGSTGRAGNEDFTIRGIGGNRVLIQVDGVRVPMGFSFGAQSVGRGDSVDIGLVKSVEILRGPASALYGSDGLAGAVSFTLSDPEDILKGKAVAGLVRSQYASADDEFAHTAILAGRSGDISALVSYSRRDFNELDNRGTNDVLGANRTTPNPQDGHSNAATARIVWDPAGGHKVRLTGEYLDNALVTDLLSGRSATIDNLVARDTGKRWRVAGDWIWEGEGTLEMARVSAYWQSAKDRQFTQEDRTPLADRTRLNTFDNRVYGLAAEGRAAFATGPLQHKLVFGADASWTRQQGVRGGTVPPAGEVFPSSAFPVTDYVLTGLFLGDEISVGPLTLFPALRFDHYKLTPQADPLLPPNFATTSQSGERVSPKMGAVLKLTEEVRLFANYAQGFRAPEPSQVNQFFENLGQGYTSRPNADLGPERSESIEGGIRFVSEAVSLSATAFSARYKDFISQEVVGGGFTPANPAIFQFINLDRVKVEGAEARMDLRGRNGITGQLAFSYARGDVIDPAAGTRVPLATVDPLKLVAGIGWRDKAGRFGGQLIATHSARKSDERSTGVCTPSCFRPGAFTILDATAFVNLGPVTLRGGVFNLTNAKYAWWSDVRGLASTTTIADAFTQPGRNGSVSLTYRF
ncbi:MAG: TonB-dependent hemoglobin/transferrin/lactoferrin family receptor [Blastomonas fulva]|uniref:TonB-dependent hemoglobin/transferrin/lactoferrin family receptor n=1 Tax=Blastomonas fulva TaxID=1550728 RepID=UPI0024E1C9EA|nr:TonB-dependent hemoglobin/transferrin/lactoferrin family receptor [Blastomonas fulva]MDK2758329.1 TonB-dependent hemoglobin/transferrin/lactoferrin family receptor [Blastomonas fulva]